MRAGDAANMALMAGAIAYDLTAPTDEQITHSAHRAIERWPVTIRAVIIVTALHLCNALPAAVDPYRLAGKLNPLR